MILVIFICLAIFSINGFSKYKNEIFLLYLFFSLVIILFSGLRYKYGADYENYYELFQYRYIVPSTEILYFSISYFFSQVIGFSYITFIFITSLLSITLKIYFYFTTTKNYLLALFIYCALIFSIYDLGFIRQAIAIGIVGIGLIAEVSSKKKAIVFYIIAFFFHTTSIIMFPIVVIGRKIVKFKVPIFPILILSFFIGNYIISNILQTFIYLIPSEFIVNKVRFYLENYEGTGFSLNVIRAILVCIFLQKSENSLLKKYYYLGTIVFLLFSFNVQFATRFYSYALLIEPVLVVNKISNMRKDLKVIAFIVSIFFYSVLFLYNVYLFDLINYRSVFELIL